MKKYTLEDLKTFERINEYLVCPTGDYSEIKAFPSDDLYSFGAFSIFGSDTDFGYSADFEPCKVYFGHMCGFGDRCKFVSETSFADSCIFGDNCQFGLSSRFESYCKFGQGCIFDGWDNFGDMCQFGKHCQFGDCTSFGNNCSFEEGTVFRSANFGKDCKFIKFCIHIYSSDDIDERNGLDDGELNKAVEEFVGILFQGLQSQNSVKPSSRLRVTAYHKVSKNNRQFIVINGGKNT